MTILNFNKIYNTVADDTEGAIYCYTIDSNGHKHTHRVLFSGDVSKTMSQLSVPSHRRSRKIYNSDTHIMWKWNKKRYNKVYVEVFLMDNMPSHTSLLSKRIKEAIYINQQPPIISYNMLAKERGWELLASNDENNTDYATTETDTIIEEKPLRIKLPKFSLSEENQRLGKEVSKLTTELVIMKEEQSKQATLLQQMFMLLSTWFATLGGTGSRT